MSTLLRLSKARWSPCWKARPNRGENAIQAHSSSSFTSLATGRSQTGLSCLLKTVTVSTLTKLLWSCRAILVFTWLNGSRWASSATESKRKTVSLMLRRINKVFEGGLLCSTTPALINSLITSRGCSSQNHKSSSPMMYSSVVLAQHLVQVSSQIELSWAWILKVPKSKTLRRISRFGKNNRT